MKKQTPCQHADIAPDARGRIVMRADKPYRCRFPVPDIVPTLPTSITRAYGFVWPPTRDPRAWKEMCAECPCWSPREGGAA